MDDSMIIVYSSRSTSPVGHMSGRSTYTPYLISLILSNLRVKHVMRMVMKMVTDDEDR